MTIYKILAEGMEWQSLRTLDAAVACWCVLRLEAPELRAKVVRHDEGPLLTVLAHSNGVCAGVPTALCLRNEAMRRAIYGAQTRAEIIEQARFRAIDRIGRQPKAGYKPSPAIMPAIAYSPAVLAAGLDDRPVEWINRYGQGRKMDRTQLRRAGNLTQASAQAFNAWQESGLLRPLDGLYCRFAGESIGEARVLLFERLDARREQGA